tara:strand:- start:30 stop:1121 length:1092 start_codon:yes stop_codon:yes gene_type:complete
MKGYKLTMKNKLSIIACTVACFTFLSADEFFEAGTTIGGYGELHWNQAEDEGGEKSNKLDFHRFIIYYGHNWTEKWSFKSEVELEHNFLPGGELELEQAYVNYHTDKWGFQGGVILPTAGLINEYHEPPLFLSVERPTYSKYIMPTTWFGNGFSFYGKFNNINWRIALLEDLEGEGIIFNDDGIFEKGNIRGGRGKGYKTTAYDWTKNFSASYTGINGFRAGGSFTMNNAPIDNDSESTLGVTMLETHAKYDANNVHAVFEYGQNSFDVSNIKDVPDTEDWTSSGYYLDLGYNIGDLVNCGKLIPWFRTSSVSTDTESDAKEITRFGLTWWPINNVAFKADYGTVKKGTSEDKEINIGIGYNF